MTRSLACALALLALLALLAAGCGSSSSSDTGPSPSSEEGGAATITMQNVQFQPKAARVKVGQKVIWKNADSFDHNVVAKSGASFKSQDFGAAGTYSFTPEKAGTIKYECTIHPGMNGVLKVG